MPLHLTLRATGSKVWESKRQQGSVVLSDTPLLISTVESSMAEPCVVKHLLTQTLFLPHCLPCWAALHPPQLFFLDKGRTCYHGLPRLSRLTHKLSLQGHVCGVSVLSYLLISLFIPTCPSLDVSVCGSLRCVSVEQEFLCGIIVG